MHPNGTAPQWPVSRERLQGDILGMPIRDPALYQSVFVHKSAARQLQERFPQLDTYERLEFVGDSIINFVVARFLFDRYPDKREGWLTRIRTKLVSGQCLCVFAQKLRLQDYIVMNSMGMREGWNSNERILEDCFEALVGALYLDMGLLAAKMFLLGMIQRHVDFAEIEKDDNYKDILMRYTQSRGVPLPMYQVLDTAPGGFTVQVLVDGSECGRGWSKSKKQAEQCAAHQALLALQVPLD